MQLSFAQINIEPGTPLTLHYGSGYWRYVLKTYANFDANQRRVIEQHILDFPDPDDVDDDDVDVEEDDVVVAAVAVY